MPLWESLIDSIKTHPALSISKTPRGIELSAPESDFDAQIAVAREVMARRKRALAELAK